MGKYLPLREKCPYSEFLCSAFSCIWTKYGEIPDLIFFIWCESFLLLKICSSPVVRVLVGNANETTKQLLQLKSTFLKQVKIFEIIVLY